MAHLCHPSSFTSYARLYLPSKKGVKGSVLSVNPELKTTKKNDSHHGLGIKRMRQIIEKYSGLLDFYEEGEYFCVQISLPMLDTVKAE